MARPPRPRHAATANHPKASDNSPQYPAVMTYVLIFLVVILSYLPALSGSFLWDDNGHVTRPDLRSLDGLWRIWTEFGATQQYYPVLHSAFWFEHLLWGDSTLGYHLLNVVLHASAAGLFGTLLTRLKVPGAWLAALLFALHPVCVESVAWIAEQKNTLSLVFYLCAALAYFRFNEQRRMSAYLLASGLFALALLTKTVTASLPAALLVVAWWQRGRLEWKRDVVPLLPWFALGAISGLITAHFEREIIGAQGSDFALGAVQRCLLAGRVVWFYLGKLLWPADLIFIYPHWQIDASVWWQWLFPIAALILTVGLVWHSRQQRGPLAVTLLFVGSLFPVLGFFNVYPFLFSYVADHFQYLASLAVFAAIGALLHRGSSHVPQLIGRGPVVILTAGLGVLTWAQCGMYRDLPTLYQTTLEKNPDCWMAHNNLALSLGESGRFNEAIPHLEAAIRLKPDFALAENNLGSNLLQLDRIAEALPHLQRALVLQPAYPAAERNLGVALGALGKNAEAIPHLEKAIALQNNFPEAELNLGVALMLTNRFPEAVPHFERAVALNPESFEIHDTYGRALLQNRRFDDAATQLEKAVLLAPAQADTQMNLALALRELGRTDEASRHYLEAVRLDPSLTNRR